MMTFLNINLVVQLFPIILILVQFMTISLAIVKPTKFVGKEKAAIEKLRKAVEDKLTLEYMKTDNYLLKWIDAKNYNYEKALDALEKSLKWRKEVDADNLPYQNFGKLKQDFMIDFETRDLEGRPVTLIPYRDSNLQKAAISGTTPDLLKLLDYANERLAQLSYNLTGVPLSASITDLSGFNFRNHGCGLCMPFYIGLTHNEENYYPLNLYGRISINAPSVYIPISQLVKRLMSKSTRDRFFVFGYDRSEWQKFILQYIAPEQLPIRFGGTSTRKLQA